MIPILKNLSGFYDVRSEIPKFIVGKTLIWHKAYKWMKENNTIKKEIHKDKSVVSENNYIKGKPLGDRSSIKAKKYNSEMASHFISGDRADSSQYILNNPNFNIKIINGDYNQFLYSDDRANVDSLDMNQCDYNPSQTEAFTPLEDEQNDKRNPLSSHKKNQKSSIFYNLLNKPQTQVINSNMIETRNQINTSNIKDSIKLFSNKILTNPVKSPRESKQILNMIKNPANKLSVNFNFESLEKNENIRKNLNSGNISINSPQTNNMKPYTNRKSVDLGSIQKDFININPIDKSKLINEKRIDLTGKNISKTISQNDPVSQLDNNCSPENNSPDLSKPL